MKTIKALILVLALTACAEVERRLSDTYYDIRDTGIPAMTDAIDGKPSSEKLVKVGQCPTVEIDKDLGTFYNLGGGPASAATSTISMSQRNTCSFGPKSVTADVQLGFTDSSDGAPATYPYFVAVLAPGGKVLAKDFFVLSADGTGSQVETIRQIIPAQNQEHAAAHKIVIGFQLTDQQLAYARGVRKQQEQLAAAQKAKYRKMENINPHAAKMLYPDVIEPAASAAEKPVQPYNK